MRISRILSIIIAFFMATTTINATEKEVNGQPYVQLYNGQWMPRFGIGTYNVPGDSVAEDAVSYALKCGYRHIDTTPRLPCGAWSGQGCKGKWHSTQRNLDNEQTMAFRIWRGQDDGSYRQDARTLADRLYRPSLCASAYG